HRRLGRALGEICSDTADTATAAHRNDHEIRLAVELIEYFHRDGALARHRAEIVVGRHQSGPGASDVIECGRSGHVVGLAAHDQLDELAAVVTDAVALLLRRLRGHIHPAVN